MDDFKRLSPDLILDAIDDLGYQTDARILELNSYENRVFQIGIESAEPVIAKFYRSNRWSTDMIIEEHQFATALADNDLSVVPPIYRDGQSLFEFKEYRFALFKKRGGRAPAVDNLDCLESLGRHIAMIHNVGASENFQFRPDLSTQEFGHDARATLLELQFLPEGLRPAYESVSAEVLRLVVHQFTEGAYKRLRLHGDCHMGNVLWREDTPHFVDFDDARGGPAIQDLWMLLSGDRQTQLGQLKAILKGYQDFRDFDFRELRLIESLRTLRLMHQSAWIARRWAEPAFQRAVPFFETERYWSNHILELREQCGALVEEPLNLMGYSY